MSRRAVAVSPHLDDAAFSAGGTLAHLVATGWDVGVVTVFTASVPAPTGFALACQTDKGLAPDVDYMALRRAEDDAAMRALGVRDVQRLPFAEAPHRGYEDAASLFAGRHDDDAVTPEVLRDALAALLEPADLVLAPQGLGAHVDHLLVVEAVTGAGSAAGRTGWWRDTPYVLRQPDARPSAALPAGTEERGVEVAAHVATKADACTAYASQLGFQFGGPEPCRAAVHDLAEAEGLRLGTVGAAEAFLLPPSLLDELGL